MSNYTSLASIIRKMNSGENATAGEYRSIESTIRGMFRPQNSKPIDKRITDKEPLDAEEIAGSRAADLQKKNKIIDNA